MYRFSRAFYRILLPSLETEHGRTADPQAKSELLRASEQALARLAVDRRYFRTPGKSLFEQIRHLFPIERQPYVRHITERFTREAANYMERLPPEKFAKIANRRCQALTRGGEPCSRRPSPHRDYCPSHRHLEEVLGSTPQALDEALPPSYGSRPSPYRTF